MQKLLKGAKELKRGKKYKQVEKVSKDYKAALIYVIKHIEYLFLHLFIPAEGEIFIIMPDLCKLMLHETLILYQFNLRSL